MTTTVRAKFLCSTETTVKWAGQKDNPPRTFDFMPVYDEAVPEDQRYAKYTPTGSLKMQVDNPAVQFVPGRHYYLDITEVEQDGTGSKP